jgi:hypothetical protein
MDNESNDVETFKSSFKKNNFEKNYEKYSSHEPRIQHNLKAQQQIIFEEEKQKPIQNFDDIKSKIRNFKQLKKDFVENNATELNFEVSREALNKYKKVPDRSSAGMTDLSQDNDLLSKKAAKSVGQLSPKSQTSDSQATSNKLFSFNTRFDNNSTNNIDMNDIRKAVGKTNNTKTFISYSPSNSNLKRPDSSHSKGSRYDYNK